MWFVRFLSRPSRVRVLAGSACGGDIMTIPRQSDVLGSEKQLASASRPRLDQDQFDAAKSVGTHVFSPTDVNT
jgi:hypothetical protein